MTVRNSRLPGFYKLPLDQRRAELATQLGLPAEVLSERLLDDATADHMVENVIAVYGLPLGVGLNFRLNERDYLVPMCVEEPSVVAAASNAARMVREGGGFTASADAPVMIAQVQLCDVPDTAAAALAIEAETAKLMAAIDASQPSLVKRGGGARGVEARVLEPSAPKAPGMIAVHLYIDCRDAMGANLVNTVAEYLAPRLAVLASANVGLRILSNLADRRRVRVSARVPSHVLADTPAAGLALARGIAAASRFAELDPYRAATHNKGVMNGVDAVIIATGNDWRSVEAGAHAYAATLGAHGGYGPIATWTVDEHGDLHGSIEMPLAVGTVGANLRAHPGARLGLRLLGLGEHNSASELAMVAAAVGLASNLAALRALASEGIQRGHMSLHARSVALDAGATGELVERVAAELAAAGDVRTDRAREVLARLLAESERPAVPRRKKRRSEGAAEEGGLS